MTSGRTVTNNPAVATKKAAIRCCGNTIKTRIPFTPTIRSSFCSRLAIHLSRRVSRRRGKSASSRYIAALPSYSTLKTHMRKTSFMSPLLITRPSLLITTMMIHLPRKKRILQSISFHQNSSMNLRSNSQVWINFTVSAQQRH